MLIPFLIISIYVQFKTLAVIAPDGIAGEPAPRLKISPYGNLSYSKYWRLGLIAVWKQMLHSHPTKESISREELLYRIQVEIPANLKVECQCT